MGIAEVTELFKWVIGIGVLAILSSIASIIGIVRSGRMLPLEVKGAVLDNKEKEVTIADKFEDIANKAADKALKAQGSLDELEELMNTKLKILEDKIDNQNLKIAEQETEIASLKCEINNYKLYTSALIEQLRIANIIPVEISSLDLEDCRPVDKLKVKRNAK